MLKAFYQKGISCLLALCLAAGFVLGGPVAVLAEEAPPSAVQQQEPAPAADSSTSLPEAAPESAPETSAPEAEESAPDESDSTSPESSAPPAQEPQAPPQEEAPAQPVAPQPESSVPPAQEVAEPQEQAAFGAPLAAVPTPDELAALAAQDGAAAAKALALVQEQDAFEEILRAILNYYYGENDSQLEAFLALLDARGAAIAANYAAAAAERAQGAAELGYYPGELIVAFYPRVAERRQEAAVEAQEGSLEETVDSLLDEEIRVVELSLEHTVEQGAALYQADPLVKYACANLYFTISEDAQPQVAGTGGTTGTNDPQDQWYINYINAMEAWDVIDALPAAQKAQSKVRVAVIDFVPQLDHPDLAGAFARNNDNSICGVDLRKTDPAPTIETATAPGQSHGSHVTGIIAATANNGQGIAGVASGRNANTGNGFVEIMPIHVFTYSQDSKGKWSWGAGFDIITNAVTWAVDNGAQVINMSLGGEVSSPANNNALELLELELEAARAAGVVITASAGNAGSATTANDNYPSDLDPVISVINLQENGTRNSTSNWSGPGSTIPKDIAAPGTGIMSTMNNGGYGNMTGTSMAAPVVAAVVALMLYAKPGLTPDEVEDALKSSARKLPAYTFDGGGYNPNVAYGCVDALAAVQTVLAENMNASVAVDASSNVELTWSGISGASSYNIYRMAGSAHAARVKIGHTAQLRYTDSGLTQGTQYYYLIEGVVGGAGGYYSDAVPYTTTSLLWTQQAAATATGFDSVQVSWQAHPVADHYRVYRLASSGGARTLVEDTTATSAVCTGLTTGETAIFQVEALKGTLGGCFSPELSVTPVLPAPAAPAVRQVGVDGHALSWQGVPGATGYRVYSAAGSGPFTLAGEVQAGSISLSGLAPNGEYRYQLEAVRNVGGRVTVSERSVVVSAALNMEAPRLTIKRTAADKVRLSWSGVASAEGYDVYRSNKESGGFKRIKRFTSASARRLDDSGLVLNKAYYYYAVPLYKTGGQWAQGPKSAIAQPNIAFTVQNLKVQRKSGAALQLKWKKNKYADGYIVYRSTKAKSGFKQVAELAGGKTTWRDDATAPNRTYYYKLRPYYEVDGKRLLGPYSNAVQGSTRKAAAKQSLS